MPIHVRRGDLLQLHWAERGRQCHRAAASKSGPSPAREEKLLEATCTVECQGRQPIDTLIIAFDDDHTVARTFIHSFQPTRNSPISGPTVDLELSDIEDAGIREVLQTPGASYGAWSILDTLLAAGGPGTPFVFREPLGQAREVKVALSGLFGRFVARAYLERYFDLSIFAHLGNRSIVLDGRKHIRVVRRARGDLPDWVACTSALSSLTVAEAKGCHDLNGPANALGRAWNQARRIDITNGGTKVTVKRIAVATR